MVLIKVAISRHAQLFGDIQSISLVHLGCFILQYTHWFSSPQILKYSQRIISSLAENQQTVETTSQYYVYIYIYIWSHDIYIYNALPALHDSNWASHSLNGLTFWPPGSATSREWAGGSAAPVPCRTPGHASPGRNGLKNVQPKNGLEV